MTQGIDKMVERLHQQSKLGPINVPRAAMRDAADALEALAKKLDEAEATFDARVQEMSERFRAVNVAEALKQLGPDHLALAEQAEDLRAELEAVKAERDRLIKAVGHHVTVRGEYFARAEAAATRAAKLEAENGRKDALLVKASIGFEPFAEVGHALTFTGATATDEIELSGEQLRPALLAAVQIKREIDAALTGREG